MKNSSNSKSKNKTCNNHVLSLNLDNFMLQLLQNTQ